MVICQALFFEVSKTARSSLKHCDFTGYFALPKLFDDKWLPYMVYISTTSSK